MKTIKELQPYAVINFGFDQVMRIDAKENYSMLTCENGKQYIFARTLKKYEKQLGFPFLRVNRSCLINTNFIKGKPNELKFTLKLKDGARVSVSRRRSNAVFTILKTI